MIDILAILLEATELKGCASGIVGALAHVDYIAHIVACTDTVGTLAPVGEFIIKVYQSFEYLFQRARSYFCEYPHRRIPRRARP